MNAAAVLDEYLDGLLAPAAPPADAVAAPVAVPAPAAASAVASVPVPAAASAAASAPAPALPPPRQAASAPLPRAVPRPAAAPPPVEPAGSPESDAAAPPHRGAADRSSRWLRLRCACQAYGLELLKVQEVLLPVPLLPLRGTAPAMLGVMNLRGQVVPVMDLGTHLGQAMQADTPETRIVVLEEKGDTLGLRVSAVEDVVTLGDPQIELPDGARVGRIHSALFRGVARQAKDPMVLLDASCLLLPEDGPHAAV